MSDLDKPALQPPSASVPTEGTALGVISMMLGATGAIPVIGIVLAFVGLIIGKMAKDRGKRTGNSVGATLGIIGMVVSSITLVVAVILLFVAGGLIGSVFSGPHSR